MMLNTIRNSILACLCLLASLAHADTTQAPVKLGVTVSLSGDYAEFGREQLNGVQMWVEDINARGALLGRKVELVAADDQSNPAKSAALYQQMLANGVELLMGPYSSEITLAASTVAEEGQVPMLAVSASDSAIWARGYKNIFGLDTPAGNYFDLALASAAERNISSIALLYADTDFAREVAAGARKKALANGINVVLAEEYQRDNADSAALAQRVAASQADLVLGASYLLDSIALTRSIRTATPNQRMVFTVGPGLREYGDVLGTDAEGVMGVTQWLRSGKMPKAQDFSYRYKARFGYNAGVHAAMGYAAGQVLEAAVRLAGSTDPGAVREQLATMKFRSLVGHYRVDESGMQAGKASYLLQWQDNRRRLVLPVAVAEANIRRP